MCELNQDFFLGSRIKNQWETVANLILLFFIVHIESIRHDQYNLYEENVKGHFISCFISDSHNTIVKENYMSSAMPF
jgi:hypothetical protein